MKHCKLVVVAIALLLPILAVVTVAAQMLSPSDALALEQQGKFAEAADAWRAIAQHNPNDAGAFASLGVDLARQQKYTEAAQAYRKALALNPKLPGIQLNLGLAEFKRGHFDAAIVPLSKALTGDPENSQARTLLGMSYYGAHRFADAVKLLRLATDADPANSQLRQMLAQSCLSAKQYDCALEQFKTILQQNPDSAAGHILFGEALDGLQKTPEAIAEFQAAAKIAPREPDVHFGLGYLYWKAKQYDEAKKAFEVELALDPTHALALAYLGDIALKNSEVENAGTLLEKSLQHKNDLRIAYFDLGTVRMAQKNYPAALKALKRAVELDPTQPDAHYRLGRVYRALGKTAEAEAEFVATKSLHQKADAAVVLERAVPQPTH
jgi:tetratricopeptide (TPR) repeat protein